MTYQPITEQCGYFSGAVNIGYIHQGKSGILIDSGIDQAAAKKVYQFLVKHELPLTSLFITHAHADHFGGAAYLQNQIPQLKTYAPPFEEAIMKYPKLEPIYLFQGNEPLDELRTKFLEGRSIEVNEILTEGRQEIDSIEVILHSFPGHSHEQYGLEWEGILFASDSYFSIETVKKHSIPFQVDATQTKKTLEKLLSMKLKGAVPGHGHYEERFQTTVQFQLQHHEQLIQELMVCLKRFGYKVPVETLIKVICDERGIRTKNLGSYLLYRTAIMAFVKQLVDEQKASLIVDNNQMFIVGL
ncbi:MBL fold metallo-hydrolase [Halalkalibacter urbisdiaboli]|uniref:MBL fold metallo-hydrolase n=1 Tax=Halalkalibacter urbisdiaboli TaxID=1960589 RepID=UPI000B44A332|nr:MBL fold metallo-hydrolase [Halalkalibacter urbisdiaboli]